MRDPNNATGRYILSESGNPIPEPDLLKWADWFGKFENRRLCLTKRGKVEVSTIFLGLDHDFSFQGPPVLWETMVFGGEHDGEMNRYCTREEALKGHENMVRIVFPPKHAKRRS